jgi:hypothetical protein
VPEPGSRTAPVPAATGSSITITTIFMVVSERGDRGDHRVNRG